MKLSNKDLDTISLHCHAVVCDMFAMMCNDKYRGAKFKWSSFSEFVETRCVTQVWLNAPISEKKMDLAKKHAAKTGKEIAERMVEQAGF